MICWCHQLKIFVVSVPQVEKVSLEPWDLFLSVRPTTKRSRQSNQITWLRCMYTVISAIRFCVFYLPWPATTKITCAKSSHRLSGCMSCWWQAGAGKINTVRHWKGLCACRTKNIVFSVVGVWADLILRSTATNKLTIVQETPSPSN